MREAIILVLILVSAACYGQVNIEDKRMERESSGFSGSVNLSITLERGNSELTEVVGKPQLIFRAGRSQWLLLNSYSFVETDESSVVNEGFSHLRYNFNISSVVIIEALAQYGFDREQDLDSRLLIGSGLRFVVLEGGNAELALGVTGMYEREELVSTGELIETPRNSDYIAVRFAANDIVTLSNTVYVQPAFDDIGDIRVLDNLELSAALSTWLEITLSLEYRYDSEPPDDIKEYDLSLENGLAVRF